MAKGFKFEKGKKTSKISHSESEKADILDYSLEEKDQTIKELSLQIVSLEERFNEQLEALQEEKSKLQYALELKDQDIEALKQTLKKRSDEVEALMNKVDDLEERSTAKKPLAPIGVKTAIDSDIIKEMKVYAKSILNEKGDFFKKVAKKFNVSKGTAYKYCKDIKSNRSKGD